MSKKLPFEVSMAAVAWAQLFAVLSAVETKSVHAFGWNSVKILLSEPIGPSVGVLLGPLAVGLTIIGVALLAFPAIVWLTDWKKGEVQKKEEDASLAVGRGGAAFVIIGFICFAFFLNAFFAKAMLVAVVIGIGIMTSAKRRKPVTSTNAG